MEKRKQPKNYLVDEPSGLNWMLSDYIEPYQTLFQSPMAKLGAIKEGLKPDAISNLLQISGATQIDVAKWLDITEPTLRKHIQSNKGLNANISEHIIQLFELFNKGM